MDLPNTKDPRNALASWNGYEFQGQIALIVVLEKMIGKEFPVGQCELLLEDLEDFSIYAEGRRVSTHQVKATKDNSIKDCQEALYKMALGLQNNNEDKQTKTYLHTSNELDTEDWDIKVKEVIEGFVPETEKDLKKALSDDVEITGKIEKLKERFNKKGTFKTKRNGVWEDIYRLMDEVSEDSEILSGNLRRAIEKYLKSLDKVDLSKDDILNRIRYYDYRNHVNVDRRSTRERIKELIREYWGEEIAELRENNIDNYRLELQEQIHCYVADNHENEPNRKGIPFSVFERILNQTSFGTREYKILRNKDIFYEKLEEYCEECRFERGGQLSGCGMCDLHEKKLWFQELSVVELERVFHIMSPHVNKSLDADSNIVDAAGLADSYFYTLNNMDFGKIVHNAKVVYQKGKDNCILTDINIPRQQSSREGIGRGLTENETIDKICSDILENREFAKERMEIDALIVSNQKEEKVRLKDMCRRLTESARAEDEWSYLKITEKKDICLWAAEKFVSENK